MAAPKGGNKGSFKKGQVNNPKGRPALPEEIKEISRQTKPEIIAAYWKFSRMTKSELSATESGSLTLLELGVKKVMENFSRNGKTDQIRHLWAECHGKPKESLDVNMPGAKRIIIENAGSGTDQTT